jgi:hypothetical protein
MQARKKAAPVPSSPVRSWLKRVSGWRSSNMRESWREVPTLRGPYKHSKDSSGDTPWSAVVITLCYTRLNQPPV